MAEATPTGAQAGFAVPALPIPIPAPVHQGVVPLPAAGWYVDPYHPQLRRWWNGTEWTDHTRVAVTEQPLAASAAPSIPGVVMPPATPAQRRDTRSSIRDLAAALPTGAVRTATITFSTSRPRPSLRSLVIAAVTVLGVAVLGLAAWWVIAHPGLLASLGSS